MTEISHSLWLLADTAGVPALTPFVSRPSLQPPFDDPVVIFGLAVLVFLAAPLVLRRYRLPGIVGIILVGAAIGPNGVGLLERGETIQLLGEVGLIYLMFLAGLEINFNQFLEYKDRSVVFGLASFLIPQVVGTVVGITVFDLSLAAALLFAAIFSSHTLLAYPVVNRLGIVNREAMTATVGGTILTDTLALLVLAVVVAAAGDELTTAFWLELGVGLAVFFLGVWLVVPVVGRWFFRVHHEESYFEFLFVMVVLFACAFLAALVGVEHIIGAFLAGLALNRLIPKTGTLMNRVEFVGNALFIPFFLLSVGMLVDARVFTEGLDTILLSTGLIVMVVVTKYAASWVTGRFYGYGRDDVLGMFGLSVGQAAAALAIVQIGFDAGIPGFDQHMINAVVVMILVVSLFSPAIVERAGNAILRARAREEYDPAATPQRILVPVSLESRHRESLLDLALAIRSERADEPIHVLSVVRPGRVRPTEAWVEKAEDLQAEMEFYAAGAEVPIVGHRRVAHNIASGIVTSAVENRISTIVIGWDGARSRAQHVFGHVIDQVLNRTSQLTIVGRARDPINTTERVLLVLPPEIDHNDGFFEALHTVKTLASYTDASIRGLAVDGDRDRIARLSAGIEPDVPEAFVSIADWNALDTTLRDRIDDGDLVVCVSARRDDLGWHEELQTLPKRISRLTDGNFVIVYPATGERADDRRFLQFT